MEATVKEKLDNDWDEVTVKTEITKLSRDSSMIPIKDDEEVTLVTLGTILRKDQNQIKKGIGGIKKLISLKKNNFSIIFDLHVHSFARIANCSKSI